MVYVFNVLSKENSRGRNRPDKGFYPIPDYKSGPIANSGHEGVVIRMVGSVGLEPTNPEGRKFTVSSNCRYANYPLCRMRESNADVIFPDLKIAVLWNGIWHYKKITKKHSLYQVQNRDKIKLKEIIKSGFIPYTIKDIGKHNKNKVNEEFKNFCKWLDEKDLQVVVLPHAQSRLMKPVGSLDLPAI
jgi:hypothetical protein